MQGWTGRGGVRCLGSTTEGRGRTVTTKRERGDKHTHTYTQVTPPRGSSGLIETYIAVRGSV